MTPLRMRVQPAALALGALEHLVGGHADQRGNDFREHQLAAFFRDIRRKRHICGLVRDLPVSIELELSARAGSIPARALSGLPAQDHGHDRPAPGGDA